MHTAMPIVGYKNEKTPVGNMGNQSQTVTT